MGAVLGDAPVDWRAASEGAARRLAAATACGALLGLLIGGVLGRLAMTLLAVLNPQATGVQSDDNFRMGQFTLSGTINLLLVATILGAVGGALYLVLRHLMIGPRWFQVVSISVGPAVVVGSILVHTDGVDFTLLQPAGLAIALFVLIPLLFGASLTLLGERQLAPDAWFARAPRWLAYAPLLLWIPLFPVFIVLALSWLVHEGALRVPAARATLQHAVVPWAARLILGGIFGLGLVDLVQDTVTLT